MVVQKLVVTLRMCISFGGFLLEILALGGRGDEEVTLGGFWWRGVSGTNIICLRIGYKMR